MVDRSSREIEDLVNGRRPGDMPGDPADPEAMGHVARFEISAATFALLRETRLRLDEEHGTRLDDDQLIAALCERATDSASSGAGDGRAKFQIAMHVCPSCDRGWQIGGGAKIAVDAATIERARCDAQHIGSIDGDQPERARQAIPPSVVRFVWSRDHARCQTPGCRSARGLEIHHIVHRENGGTHDPATLTLRCSACHAAHHAGVLTISGTAPDRLVTTRNVGPQREHRRAPSPEALAAAPGARDEAIVALVSLGWKRSVATAAVDEAMGHVAHGGPVHVLIREALRRCPRPLVA